VVWTFEQPERGSIVSSPFVSDDRVYIPAIQDNGLSPTGAVYCLDRATGKPLWKFDDGGAMQQTFSSPCLDADRLYVGEGMHGNFHCKLYCLDASSGRKRWDFTASGHIESSPCVAVGRVFFGAGDDGVYCLDAATGHRIWQFQAQVHVDANPFAKGPCVYFGSGISKAYKKTAFFCLDAATGRMVWEKTTGLPAWGSPVVDGGQVFYGLANGRLEPGLVPLARPEGALVCRNARTGDLLWSYKDTDAVFGRPASDAQSVYFGARDGFCRSLDRHNGEARWQVDLGSPIIARTELCDGHLYVAASRGKVACLDALTGGELWSFNVGQHTQTTPRLYSAPAVVSVAGAHHEIYFGSELMGPVNSAAMLFCLRD
jgi:outer membrane protein assembly factor BamB